MQSPYPLSLLFPLSECHLLFYIPTPPPPSIRVQLKCYFHFSVPICVCCFFIFYFLGGRVGWWIIFSMIMKNIRVCVNAHSLSITMMMYTKLSLLYWLNFATILYTDTYTHKCCRLGYVNLTKLRIIWFQFVNIWPKKGT